MIINAAWCVIAGIGITSLIVLIITLIYDNRKRKKDAWKTTQKH